MYISALLLAVSLSYHPPPPQLVASGGTEIAPTRSLAFPQESGTVEVKLRATTSSLPVWGMLPVSIELRNATGTPIPYSKEMLSGQGHGNAYLLAEVLATGSERPMTLALIPSHLRSEGFGRTVQMLDPGEKVTKRLLTITGNYGLVSQDDLVTMKFLSAFPEPGEYEVRAVYHLGEKVYSSNTLRVAVTPPPANGVAALEYFKAMKNTGWIYAPQLIRTLTGEPLEEMIHLSERFAPNIYTDYARLALAQRHYRLAIWRSEADVIASNRRSNLRKADLYELGIHSSEFNLKGQRKQLARKIKRLKDEMEKD